MANLEKHKKNALLEWLGAEESEVPTRSRGSHTLGAYLKIPKPVLRKSRRALPQPPATKLDLSMVREPAPPPKMREKHSQPSSPEHLLKLDRLSKLRAPYRYRPAAKGSSPASRRLSASGKERRIPVKK